MKIYSHFYIDDSATTYSLQADIIIPINLSSPLNFAHLVSTKTKGESLRSLMLNGCTKIEASTSNELTRFSFYKKVVYEKVVLGRPKP